MAQRSKSIALVSKDSFDTGAIVAGLRACPGVKVEEYSSSLSELNGTAVKLAGDHDLILFRTEAGSDSDLLAITEIRAKTGGKAILLALTDAGTSLEQVRRLARAGVDEVLPDTITAEELQEQIEALSRPAVAEVAAAGRTGKVITVTQARGGVGSTTVAVNLADSLLGRGGMFRKARSKRVAVVDLDLQFGSVGSFLDSPPNDALFQLASDGSAPDATFLQQAMRTLPCGLSVLSAPSRFVPLDALTRPQMAAMIDGLRAEFDYVVVDLPRMLVDWIAPVLERSDRLILVTDSSVPSVQHARRLIDFYTEENLGLQIDIVVNHEKKPLISGRHHAEAAKVLERPFRHWIPHDPKAAREAIDRGVPLSQAAGRSAIARSIEGLGRSMTEALAPKARTASAN